MSYTSSSIKVLKGLEACRKRPGMYIGNIEDGVFQLLKEVLDNSIDEYLGKHCDKIDITFGKDGYATVSDNGRGIPVDIHEGEGISAAVVIMTQLHAGGKLDQESYKISGGLHGVGVSVVNALSKDLELRIYKDGKEYFLSFSKGDLVQDITEIGPTKKTGTSVRFIPDEEILPDQTFNLEQVKKRISELAYLNPGLKICLKDERENYEEEFYEPQGIKAFVEKLASKKELLHEVINISGHLNSAEIKASLVWTNSYSEDVKCFTNNIPQSEGGTHLVGFKTALTRCINNYIQKDNSFGKKVKDIDLTGEDIREGVVCVLSVYFPEPQFASQTKEKLVTAYMRGVVEGIVSERLDAWLEETPEKAKELIQKITNAALAREAARKSRDLFRKNKDLGDFSINMASKFANCSEKDPTKTQLFIVEGDSAGGNVKLARNRANQAVIGLRGKILNVEKASYERMIGDENIRNLIAIIGTGIGENFDITKIRYNKIIIMTDADVDGSHILTLLVTLFFKYMRPIIENGYLYVALPPLYGVKQGSKTHYLHDDAALADFFFQRNMNNIKFFENETALDEEASRSFLKELSAINNDLSHRNVLFQAALVNKITDEEEFDAEKILQTAGKLQPGKWKYANEQFVFEKNGIINKYTFNFESIPMTHIMFIERWGNFWDSTVSMEHNSERKIYLNPLEIFEIFNKKGRGDLTISRFKGLGEMDYKDLGATAMKSYIPLQYDNEESAQKLIETLMGEEVSLRREFIESLGYLETDD
jgi:DNA gyrase subunit B